MSVHPVPPGNPPAGIRGVLGTLEDLAAEAGAGGSTTSAVPEHFQWLPLRCGPALARPDERGHPMAMIDPAHAERFAAVDAVQPQRDSLRVGMLFLCGQTGGEGRAVRLFEPLITLPVRIDGPWLRRTGDVELTNQVTDRHDRMQLEQQITWGGGLLDDVDEATPALITAASAIADHGRRIAHAMGHDVADVVTSRQRPSTLRDATGLRIVFGLGLYALGPRTPFSPAAGLAEWQHHIGTTWTALHSLYLDHVPPPVDEGPDLPSPYELTQAQHAAVRRSRSAPVSVIAGAPGTGKTHTIAAIVGDAVARGRSVLVAAKADATVEAITDLLARRPGPDPVRFGSGTSTGDLGRRLAAGEPTPVPRQLVNQRFAEMDRAAARRDGLWRAATSSLRGLALLGDGPTATALRHRLPGLAGPEGDLVRLGALIEEVGTARPSWWQRRRRQAWAELLMRLDVAEDPPPADLHAVAALASVTTRLHQLDDRLGSGVDWEALDASNHQLQLRTGEWMDALARDEHRLDRAARGVIAALATALRAGRATRRAKLAALVGRQMTVALPVWVGTLADIDDLLPFQPAMFDLVVLDEASSIDQPRAAAALLRAARAVVVGDPQQLRHVSFVPGAAIGGALDVHLPAASPAMRARLDVRANSIFDVAASGWPVQTLAEHFRSVPHLFDFVGARLYGGQVALATRTPVTDRHDRINVIRLDGRRNDSKVVSTEVRWVMERLDQLRADGVDSVGVVSPFRAQADALVEAARRRLGYRGIAALGLRIGTVHAFQGMERDHVIVSLGIGRDDGAGTWRFASDRNLFAVLATRAREAMEMIVSADPPAGSLLADYLAQVDHRPPEATSVRGDAWVGAIAEALTDAGAEVTAPYAVGHHAVDLVAFRGDRFVGVITRLHPDGPDAHVRRQVELRLAGWPLALALPQVWGADRGALALALTRRLDDSAM